MAKAMKEQIRLTRQTGVQRLQGNVDEPAAVQSRRDSLVQSAKTPLQIQPHTTEKGEALLMGDSLHPIFSL